MTLKHVAAELRELKWTVEEYHGKSDPSVIHAYILTDVGYHTIDVSEEGDAFIGMDTSSDNCNPFPLTPWTWKALEIVKRFQDGCATNEKGV